MQFTFSLPQVIPNPFASPPVEETAMPTTSTHPHLVPAPSPSPFAAHTTLAGTRKRGWEPSYVSPSTTASSVTTRGYLDTPAKYRTIASTSPRLEDLETMADDLRPAKRRKTVTESIVATAYSAALIGTAVGFTVYRLWRDRSRAGEADEQQQQLPNTPPPPYEPDWADQHRREIDSQTLPSSKLGPAHYAKRPRHITVGKAPRRRQRKPLPCNIPFEGSFGPDGRQVLESDDERSLDSQMDSMSQQLAKLIEEGRRALGKEVVILSEAQEDEVDDGSGQWIEEEPKMNRQVYARPRSPQKQKRRPRTPKSDHNESQVPLEGSYRGSHMYSNLTRKTKGLPPPPSREEEVTVLLEA